MPNVLPLPMMFEQRLVMLESSPGLNVAAVKGVSVRLKEAAGATCSVVPQASMPPAKAPVPGKEATSLTTTEVGLTPVRVLLIRSLSTDRETSAFGVTRQEQQEINCSSGENVYTFAQIFPMGAPNPGPFRGAPLRPLFVMLITESPWSRLEA